MTCLLLNQNQKRCSGLKILCLLLSLNHQKKKVDVLFESKTQGKIKPPKTLTVLNDTLSDYVDANTSSVLTYPFKDYIKKGKFYKIPLVVDTV